MKTTLAPAVALLLLSCNQPVPPPVAPPAAAPAPAATGPTTLTAEQVEKRTRAITLDISSTASAGAWARPGDHLDVLATFADPQTNQLVAVTLLQNVRVLATSKAAATLQNSTVSLLVIPEEAELLTLGRRLGELTLTLRNEEDVDVLEERGRATVNTLLSGERSRVLQQKRFTTIQVIRGSGSGSGGGGPVSGGGYAATPAAPPPADDLAPARGVSTGKVSEMYLKHYGVNPTLETTEEPTSTFAADVDTGSYTLARAWLGRGELPHEAAVRVEEFVNAFDYSYRPPETEAFAVQVEAFPSPSRKGYHLLHVGVQGKKVEAAERKSANLVFVLDVSGSMDAENRLGLAKRALELLVANLQPTDSVALVIYGDQASVALGPTPASQREKILEAIAAVRSGGSTNAQAGLELGYALAAKAFKPEGINRVVLCSDGVANNGVTTADALFGKVKARAARGISLSTVGFGMGTYNDVLMERLADQGGGNYAYVDRLAEAQRIFSEQLTGTLQVIAKDVKLQLEFNPAAVERYRLLGFENRKLAKEDFANDKIDAGEIGAGHAVTALYEVKLKDRGAAKLATFRARFKEPDSARSGLIEKDLPMAVVHDELRGASGPARLSLVVAGFAEKLRGSYWARAYGWDELLAAWEQLPAPLRARPDVLELQRLIQTARRLDTRGDRFARELPVSAMDFDRPPRPL